MYFIFCFIPGQFKIKNQVAMYNMYKQVNSYSFFSMYWIDENFQTPE